MEILLRGEPGEEELDRRKADISTSKYYKNNKNEINRCNISLLT
jgi:hypothetical protein